MDKEDKNRPVRIAKKLLSGTLGGALSDSLGHLAVPRLIRKIVDMAI